jgi:exopolyphosphatase/guanosine-5'-triphosphate,3'-diphosphate pyrophosphatase
MTRVADRALDRVLRRTCVETLLVSESDILDGLAWSVA